MVTAALFLVAVLPAWAAHAVTMTWVRHAQSTANAAGIVDTSVPGPGLTALGDTQAQVIAETLATGQACYWSRSRQRLWRKGESSGHWQQLVEARLDCDGDAVLLIVDQQGPACHTGRPTCFYNAIDGDHVHIITEASA